MKQSIDLDWLEDFLEVATKENFTLAAKARAISQSSLSRRIKSLELWLNVDLIDRQSFPTKLTPAGAIFQPVAREISTKLQDVRRTVQARAPATRVPIYTLQTLAATFVPQVIRGLRAQLQDSQYSVKTSVHLGTLDDCVEALSYLSAPFMICYESEAQPIAFAGELPNDAIERVTLAKDRLIPVCSPENLKKYREAFEDGRKIPYVMYSDGTYLSRLVDQKIDELNIRDRLELIDDAEMGDTLRNLVREGEGIAWVLNSTAKKAFEGLELRWFDFGLGDASFIDLEVKMFRAVHYSTPDIRRLTLEQIWEAASKLEKDLTPTLPERP